MQDRPDKQTLLDAIAAFLVTEVRPKIDDPGVSFRVLVAAHVCSQVAAEDLHVTSSLDEARAAARAIVGREYGALCVGGGDGTFMQAAQDLLSLSPDRLPVLLSLRLGGGNAISDVCGHAGGPLHEGELAEGCVTCPWHGSVFRLDGGDVVHGPATGPQPRYEVRVAAGRVSVRLP